MFVTGSTAGVFGKIVKVLVGVTCDVVNCPCIIQSHIYAFGRQFIIVGNA